MAENVDLQSKSLIKSEALDRRLISQNGLARALDIFLILLAAPYIILAIVIIAVSILADSGGPIIFRQTRIGRNGRKFQVYKFRTMLPNADQVLQDYLNKSPELRAEWVATHKLKHDPRVTRLGSFLRKSSLDELPQIWNIFTGDMGLVGPRPIVDA